MILRSRMGVEEQSGRLRVLGEIIAVVEELGRQI